MDQNTYILAKDSQNHNVTNHQIHDIVFKIVLEIDRICRKNDIPYALAFGSAIGLLNYQDFIPWDDDADIILEYRDYLRLVEALKVDLSDDFTFECYEVDARSNVIIPPLKVRYKRSYIREKNRFTLPNLTHRGNGIFIDICPFMGVPEKEKEHRRLIAKSKRIMPLYVFLEGFLHINPKKMKRSLKRYEKEVAEKYKDSNYVSQTILIPFQDTPRKMVKHLSWPKEVIYPFREYDFRGHKLFSVNNLEEFVRLRYGEEALHIKEKNKYNQKVRNKKKGEHLARVDIF